LSRFFCWRQVVGCPAPLFVWFHAWATESPLYGTVAYDVPRCALVCHRVLKKHTVCYGVPKKHTKAQNMFLCAQFSVAAEKRVIVALH
jgi:hypothetical protein